MTRLLALVLLLAACRSAAPASDPAILDLRLHDPATGEPKAGPVQLWRVDLPEGDQCAGVFDLGAPKAGPIRVAPGLYRAVCEAHAASAPALPVFEVKAPSTQVSLAIDAPEEREVWVEVFDAEGRLFERAEYSPSSRGGGQRVPAWLRPRSGLEPSVGVVGGISSRSSDDGPRTLKRGAHGFSLGREREDGSLYATSRAFLLRIPDHGTVSGTLRFEGHEEARYRILLVEKGRFEGLFTLDDEHEVDLNRLRVSTPLEPDTQPRPPQWWLDVPVSLAVSVPGYKRLELEFRLRDGLPRARRLEKAG